MTNPFSAGRRARVTIVKLIWFFFFLVTNPFRNDVALAGFRAPTLILQHTRDEVAPPEDAVALAELLPHATFVAVDATHNGPDDPRERAREDAAIEAFLATYR